MSKIKRLKNEMGEQKGFIVPILVFIIIALVMSTSFYIYKNESSKKILETLEKYPILKNESLWRNTKPLTRQYTAPIGIGENSVWNISSKNIIKGPGGPFVSGYYCGDKEAYTFIYSSDYQPGMMGGGGVSIIDCGNFYLVNAYGDGGNKLYGPFDFK